MFRFILAAMGNGNRSSLSLSNIGEAAPSHDAAAAEVTAHSTSIQMNGGPLPLIRADSDGGSSILSACTVDAEGRGNGKASGNKKNDIEKAKYGFVSVEITCQSNKKAQDPGLRSLTVTPRGTIFYGMQANVTYISQALAAYGHGQYPPCELSMQDSRANKVLVIHSDNWYVVPSPEVFSRHSGTCLVLGDRDTSSAPYALRLGDCIRLGSVGLVVSDYKLRGGREERLDSSMIQFLKDEALAIDLEEDLAALAADENEMTVSGKYAGVPEDVRIESAPSSPSVCNKNTMNRLSGVEKASCYMCYENHDTPEDRLIAPCNCKGDTRYLHIQCLQKWYFSSVSSNHALVIRTTGTGAPSCKICGAAYKSTFKNHDGRTSNILESSESEGAFLTLTVVTKHDSNPELFNSKFRLNFNGDLTILSDTFREMQGLGIPGLGNSLLIGRSSACNMILDYRTVSTVHARIFYDNNNFYLQDNASSNGTMVYIRGPLQMTFGKPITLRTGRSTMRLLAKRTWAAQLKSIFSRKSCTGTASSTKTDGTPSADDLYAVMVRASLDKNGRGGGKGSPRKLSPTEIDSPVEEVTVVKDLPKIGLSPQGSGTIVACDDDGDNCGPGAGGALGDELAKEAGL